MLIPLVLAFQATVWTVDDSGGPGVDFTDLPPAIAAASRIFVLVTGSSKANALEHVLSPAADPND